MISSNDNKPDKIAFFLIRIAILFFAAISIIDDIEHGDYRVLVVSTICIGIAFMLIHILHYLNRYFSEAFTIPTSLYLMSVAAMLIIKTFPYFFPVSLAICCLCSLYVNKQKVLWYILLSNCVSLVLLLLGIPLYRLDNGVVSTITFSEGLVNWVIAFGSSIFVFAGTVFSASRAKSAKNAEDSFNALLNSTPNKVVLLDHLNRVTYFGVQFAEMINVAVPEQTVGRSIFDLFKDTELKMMFYRILQEDCPYIGTHEIVQEGKSHYFEVISAELADGTPGRLINLIDITPVMESKIMAEDASRSKSQFLATMSHEIRTPLNAIIGLSEIELQKKQPDETHRNIEKVYNSGVSLLGIINDILDISKIEAGSFTLVPVDYDTPSLINDAVQLNIVRIGTKHITFKLELDSTLPKRLFGDELRVKQILNNLLSNAFKYTETGTVSLRVAWERREENAWLTFTVQDTGRGIKKEDINKLFNEYMQLDAKANRHIEGTGLGLSITKNLVKLMEGTISLESEYGKGSTFTVQFPQRIIDGDPIGERIARNLEHLRYKDQRGQASKLIRNYMPYGKVLVVDDVETNLDVVRGLMLPYGLSIDYATSGAEAISRIRAAVSDAGRARYDLVLMDHMMPGMDGIEAVRIIRNEIDSDYARNVPIVALTANALAGNEDMFLAHGFNAYISKPIDIMQLDVVLNVWIRNRQSRETLLMAEMEMLSQKSGPEMSKNSLLDDVSVDGIDIAQGRERYNNDAAYLDILRSYHMHTPALLEKLRSLSAEDSSGISLQEYAVLVHGLKGSSFGICANPVGKAAEELEAASKAGDLKRVLENNALFIESVELLLIDIGDLLKKAEAEKSEKRKAAAPDPALLEKLLDACRRFKSSQMEEAQAELESFEYESGGELVSWLREQLDNLEYDAIRERLESMQNDG
jgi:signal transduction histidine kinase/DNA-binding response OmpR family regulator